MSRTWKIIFAMSGVVGLLSSINSPVLFPYPLFVLAYLRGWRFPWMKTSLLRLMLSTLLCTTILEVGAWLDNFIRNAPEPALFHPQLIPDLIMGIGVYAAWWLTWWLVLQRYRFTTQQVFVTTGLYGVMIEQQGKIFLAGLATMPLGLIFWAFVFIAYGSTMALAFFLVRDSFGAKGDHWLKYIWAWAGLLVLTIITSKVWALILSILNFTPPPKLPMSDHPFW